MSNSKKTSNLSTNYNIAGLIAITYSIILVLYSIYYQFLYTEGTWTHGLITLCFEVLSNFIWIGVLFAFKHFLSNILNYNKVNSLLNTYLIFLTISTISIATVLFKSIQLYLSLNETATLNNFSFTNTSILGGLLLFISNFIIIIFSVLIGNNIRKIDIIEDKIFKTLGFSLIAYGIISLLSTLTVIENNIIQIISKAFLAVLIGLILKRNRNINPLFNRKVINNPILSQPEIHQDTHTVKSIVVEQKREEIPYINIEELENKELILSYYKNLSKDELFRLELIIEERYGQNLTSKQKNDLAMLHIKENKLYDHQRFLPKQTDH